VLGPRDRDVVCAIGATLAVVALLTAAACQEHIPAYALLPDDSGADASSEDGAVDASSDGGMDAPIDALETGHPAEAGDAGKDSRAAGD
jgi:hypothetical protein